MVLHRINQILTATILVSLFFLQNPAIANAQEIGAAAEDPQVTGYLVGAEEGEFDSTAAVGSVAADLLGCSAGQLLSNLIQSGLNSLFGTLTSQLKSQLLPLVPIDTQYTELEKDTKQQTAAHTIQSFFGIPFGASWDAMAWCIVNSIINDIANKTIAWANSGFNGKPAFIENPERFFQGLSDKEAMKFIESIAYGGAGINLCEPFRVQVAMGLSEAYGNSYYGGSRGSINAYNAYSNRSSCTIDQIANNFENIGSNSVQVGSLKGFWTRFRETTRDQNNAWGSYQLATDFLDARISNQQNNARFELELNKGWMSFKKCEDPEDTQSCGIYTPGSLIQHSLEKSLDIPKDRLVLANRFDQVVTAIVNNLIKVALNKVLESGE